VATGNLWVRLARFLLPEPGLSLKLVFDNLRNYIVAAWIYAVARWPIPTDGATQAFIKHHLQVDLLSIGKALIFVLAFVCLLFNLAQSVVITLRVFEIGMAHVVGVPAQPSARCVHWLTLMVVYAGTIFIWSMAGFSFYVASWVVTSVTGHAL
jgi:hypothetical protein